MTDVGTLPGVSPKPKPQRTVRVSDRLWNAALAKAEENEENVSDVIRRALERYVED